MDKVIVFYELYASLEFTDHSGISRSSHCTWCYHKTSLLAILSKCSWTPGCIGCVDIHDTSSFIHQVGAVKCIQSRGKQLRNFGTFIFLTELAKGRSTTLTCLTHAPRSSGLYVFANSSACSFLANLWEDDHEHIIYL